ncbi:MAG: L-seryl-tRNA(Sec) selenium transferase [Deltaproteobacteria bacterium]|nr:L-seryl-tRNA(Sec) selenium transferase [Deltaproteobacteria bacterium]MBW2673147.1 L-seryl-tRNA(Sec) selenium transferase [Deltaproteobacteria bacterium]
MNDKTRELLKNLPKIDEVFLLLGNSCVFEGVSRDIVVGKCRQVVEEMRRTILDSEKKGGTGVVPASADEAAQEVCKRLLALYVYSLHRVVNATGIILHTNLGRAPLCEDALQRIVAISTGYSNLEFNLDEGKRGTRYDHVRELLCCISGAENALIVNNNAAAVLLVLNTLSEGKEAIVSRGELIEIGGAFRIPEVMEKSGAVLREVGTTNRTHLSDYENAVCPDTGLILKVHTSNFKVLGFTDEIGLGELVELGKKNKIPVMNDLGSGCFVPLDSYGFEREPTVQEVIKAGTDVVTFSGDKLLGGPQAGIILGKNTILEKIKKNPLNRALRIDKLTLAALEATMMNYIDLDRAVRDVPVLRSLTEPVAEVEKRAHTLVALLEQLSLKDLTFSIMGNTSMAGGGSLPTQEIPTFVVTVHSRSISPSRLERKLRKLNVPIIARIYEDTVLFDLRTIAEEELVFITDGMKQIATEA